MAYSTRLGFDRTSASLATAILALGLAGGCTPTTGDPARANLQAHLAQLAEAGDDDEASALPGAASSRSDTSSQIRHATVLANTGRNKEALDIAVAAYDHDKTNISAALLIGRLNLRLGDDVAARAIYQQILARSPDNLQSLNGLGIADVMGGMLPTAEASFRRAIATSPSDGGSRGNLALTLALEGKTDEAIPMLEAQMRQDMPSDRDRSNLALAYAAAGKAEKARQLLTPRLTLAEANEFISTYALHGAPGPGVTTTRPQQPEGFARTASQ